LRLRAQKESVITTRSRRKFTPEFKAEAVEMVEAAGGNIAQVAKELGIYDSTLGNWVHRSREQAAGAPTAEEHAEIRELRRVKRLAGLVGRDVARIAAHSLRAGLITATVSAGAHERDVMRRSPRRSVHVFRGYVRDVGLFDANAAAAVGL
jgi:hypothetical protein